MHQKCIGWGPMEHEPGKVSEGENRSVKTEPGWQKWEICDKKQKGCLDLVKTHSKVDWESK